MGGNHTLECTERLKEGEAGGVEGRARGASGTEMGAEGRQHPEGSARPVWIGARPGRHSHDKAERG